MIGEVFGRLVEAEAVIPSGHLEIIVVTLAHVEINTTSQVCQALVFVEFMAIIVQMSRNLDM